MNKESPIPAILFAIFMLLLFCVSFYFYGPIGPISLCGPIGGICEQIYIY